MHMEQHAHATLATGSMPGLLAGCTGCTAGPDKEQPRPPSPPPSPPANTVAPPQPPFASGLVAWFTAASRNDTSFTLWDLSGAGSNATLLTAASSVGVDANSRRSSPSTLNNQPFLVGGAGGRVMLPALPAGGFTMFHVARYNGASRGRILASPLDLAPEPSFVSGFDRAPNNGAGGAGVACRGGAGWITATTGSALSSGADWVISTDQRALHRSQGLDRTLPGVTAQLRSGSPEPAIPLCINCQANASSDWALAVLLVYGHEMSLFEVMQVEDALSAAYGVPLGRVGTPCKRHVDSCMN